MDVTPDSFQKLLDGITPEIYQNLKTAVEIGRWPNGARLSDEQRALSMQAVIAYEAKHLPPEQRSGYMPPKKTSNCGPSDATGADEAPLKWRGE